MQPQRTTVTALAATIFVLGLMAAALRTAPPQAKRPDAPANTFSASRAIGELRRTVGGDHPHPVGSARNRETAARIINGFKEIGYSPELSRSFACDAHGTCAEVENIIVRHQGSDPKAPAVMLAAHYDSVPAGPGASDDGVGVATILEIARIVRPERFRNPIVFLVDDGEEAGLLGAEAFVARPLPQPIGMVINIEARGTFGPSFLFESSKGSAWFMPIVASALARPITSSLFAAVYDRMPNDTDLTVFKRAGLQGVNFAFARGVWNYHTPNDDLKHVDPRTVQHHGDNALATLRAFANSTLQPQVAAEAIWFDLLGFFIVSWPAGWTIWIAIASCVVAVAAAWGRTRISDGVIGFLTFFASIAIAGLVGYALSLVAGAKASWIAQPLPILIAAAAAGAAIAAVFGRWLGHRDLLPGYALGWNVIAIALAVAMTGASYIVLIPAALMTAALLVGRFTPSWRNAGSLLAFVAACLLWLPLAMFLYDMLGAPAVIGVAVIVALIWSTATPAGVSISGSAAVLALVVVAAGTIATALLPPYTQDHPQRINVLWYDDGSAPRWLVTAMRDDIRKTARFSDDRVVIAEWLRNPGRLWAAPAPPLPIPPVTIDRSGRTVSVRSPRGADRIALMIKGAGENIRVNGAPLPPRSSRFRSGLASGWKRVVVYGSEMVVDVGTDGPVEVIATDTSFSLPPEGKALQVARNGSSAVPSQDGDVTITSRRERL